MRRSGFLALVLVGAALCAPRVHGGDAADLAARLVAPDPARRAEAVREVRASWSGAHRPFLDPRALRGPVLAALDAADPAVRAAAAASLGDLGLGGKRRLAGALSDGAAPVRAAAARALVELVALHEPDETDPMPALVALLHDPDAAVRAAALAGVAGHRGRDVEHEVAAREAAPRMLALARDADATVRCEALRALAAVAPEQRVWSAPPLTFRAVEAAFEAGLDDPAPAVRAEASRRFVGRDPKDGPRAVRLATRLGALLDDADPSVRWTAVEGLWALTADAARLAPHVAPFVLDGDGRQMDAIELVAAMGPDARAAVPALVAVLGEGKSTLFPGAGGWAVEALYDLGPDAAETLPLLEAALRSGDATRRADAAEAVATLHGEPRRCADLLFAALVREATPAVRAAILRSAATVARDDGRLPRAVRDALCAPPAEAWAALDAVATAPRAWLRAHAPRLSGPVRRLGAARDATLAAAARVAQDALDGSPPPPRNRRAATTPSPVPDPTVSVAEQVARWAEAATRGHAWTLGPVSNPFRAPFRLDLGLTREAMDALARMGPAARAAVPTLRRLRADTRLTAAADAALARIER